MTFDSMSLCFSFTDLVPKVCQMLLAGPHVSHSLISLNIHPLREEHTQKSKPKEKQKVKNHISIKIKNKKSKP